MLAKNTVVKNGQWIPGKKLLCLLDVASKFFRYPGLAACLFCLFANATGRYGQPSPLARFVSFFASVLNPDSYTEIDYLERPVCESNALYGLDSFDSYRGCPTQLHEEPTNFLYWLYTHAYVAATVLLIGCVLMCVFEFLHGKYYVAIYEGKVISKTTEDGSLLHSVSGLVLIEGYTLSGNFQQTWMPMKFNEAFKNMSSGDVVNLREMKK